VPGAAAAMDWTRAQEWTFEPLDSEAFPAVELARTAGRYGGSAPAVYNAANEVCVDAFHEGRLPFLAIVDVIAQVVGEHVQDERVATPEGRTDTDVRSSLVAGADLTLEAVLAADAWARGRAAELVDGGGVARP
jgi:1-deoxy-D-xylulose-5-phosphate reductoisomerase